jgi:P-type Ca2+ transporter type 2C
MWHDISLESAIQKLKTDAVKGLTNAEVALRIGKYGQNVLPKSRGSRWWAFFIRQFTSPLVYILLIGAGLTAYLGEWIDMSVILLAVMVNVAVGFWQEFRSNNILEKLSQIVEVHALVMRGGSVHEISADEVVPGDVLVLKPGSRVPADARVVEAKNLEVDEALLTGESAPARKLNTCIPDSAVLGDRDNIVHMGTNIVRGEGTAVVVATGGKTELGHIAHLTNMAEDDPTPLQHKMAHLGKVLAILVGIASVIIFFLGIFEGHSLEEMFTTAIAVAVAAIPEGLPAAISIVLAVAAQRTLGNKGVIKRLLAAETLGSATVIVSDKTGTLTEGQMKVERVITYGAEDMHLREVLALSNEAVLENKDGELLSRGEVTDKAKMDAFVHAGGDYDELMKREPRVSLLPFDPEWKYIASLHKKERGYTLYVTGAPETILSLSTGIMEADGVELLKNARKNDLRKEYEALAGEGYRMIALAERKVSVGVISHGTDLEDDSVREKLVNKLVFLGFAVMRDPIRATVRESLHSAREAGVHSIMLTGDHLLTARAVGRELGFKDTPEAVIEGEEIEKLTNKELSERLPSLEIGARVNPEHKMRIVNLLQRSGQVVAMTGDGVNDAPALKASDIGVALNSGTEIAKSASDLILLDNSYTTIVSAIKQGRIAFDNIRKVTVFLLAGSFSELILIMVPLFLGIALPLTAVQILWTNLVEDTMPNVALAFEPGEDDVMKRKPIERREPVLNQESKIMIFVVGIFVDFVLLALFLFLYFQTDFAIEYIRTIIFAALGLDTFFYIYSIKSLRKPIYAYNLFSNRLLFVTTIIGVGLMLAAIYVPFLNSILATVPLHASAWVYIIGLSMLKLLGIEIAKWWFIHRKDPALQPVGV